MNSLCEILGIKYPVIQAGMVGGATTLELVSAVSNAGGLDVLAASRLTPNQLKEAILKIKWLADHFPVIAGQGLRLLKKDQSASEIVNEIVSTANNIASSNLIKDLSF